MVHVDERGRDGTLGGRTDPCRISHVLERAAAVLMQQASATLSQQKQIRLAVVVVVAGNRCVRRRCPGCRNTETVRSIGEPS